jgi:PilZ domain
MSIRRFERRHSPRLVVNSPVLVSLGESEARLLFDVGEGGLSVHGLVPTWRHNPITIAFDLPEGNGSVYARVAIAWTSDSNNRTGLRFVNVAERTHQRLKAWVGSKVYVTNLYAADGASIATDFPGVNSAAIPFRAPTESESAVTDVAPERPSRSSKLRRQLMFLLAVVILCMGFVLLGYYLRRIMERQKPKDVPEPKAAEVPSSDEIVSVQSSAAKIPSLPSGTDLNMPGFVRQVAAMSQGREPYRASRR